MLSISLINRVAQLYVMGKEYVNLFISSSVLRFG
jgi:hypothetical protein